MNNKIDIEWPPKKLPKGFPLTVHTRGYVKSGVGWICGKKSPEEALRIYHKKADAKLNNRPVPKVVIANGNDQSVAQLILRYKAVRNNDASTGRIKLQSLSKIDSAMGYLMEHEFSEMVPGFDGKTFGDVTIKELTPDHFADFGEAMLKLKGEAFARSKCRLVNGLFNYAIEEDWIGPTKFGRRFKEIAWSRATPFKGIPPTPNEIKTIITWLDRATKKIAKNRENRKNLIDERSYHQFKAGVLLGLNGGYGSSELAQLPRDIVDLKNGVIDYRRGKTDKSHVVPLWPETIKALKVVCEQADKTRPGDELVFRTREGRPWAYEIAKEDEESGMKVVTVDNFGQWFSKVAKQCGIKRPGQSFYSLKDLHCSIADECPDQSAAYRLTGHQYHTEGRDPYVTVNMERLKKVVNFIRQRTLLA